MKRLGWIIVGLIVFAAGFSVFSLPIWGMGAAVFLDSSRSVIAASPSPDGRRIAQLERLIVGGTPSVVVTVRSSWKPNWYLWSCAAASHYEDVNATIAWAAPSELDISSSVDPQNWDVGRAPFHNRPCSNLTVSIVRK
jgi:hypothetical protein